MATSLAFSLALLSLAQAVLPAYPHYPPHPLRQPPSALVYPHGVYTLNNDTHRIRGQDFALGAKSPQDKLLLHTTVYKRPGIWSSYATKEITFPPPGNRMRVNITQVNAYDRGMNGTGGFVKLVSGGIGRENVTLLFKSQKNKAINFEVDVFGVARA